MEAENLKDLPHRPIGESESSSLRWIIVIFAIALLVLGGYRGYQWWVTDPERLRVEEVQAPENAGTSAPDSSGSTPEELAPVRVEPARPGEEFARSAEPLPPAVVGARIRKCIKQGGVTYTNDPCPEGAAEESASVTTPLLAAPDRPSQREATCRFLTAEISRLSYEFQQTLPPPILDEISSDLKVRREQAVHLNCPVSMAEAAATKSTAKVIQEKEKP